MVLEEPFCPDKCILDLNVFNMGCSQQGRGKMCLQNGLGIQRFFSCGFFLGNSVQRSDASTLHRFGLAFYYYKNEPHNVLGTDVSPCKAASSQDDSH
jgi:hypothetical protein